MYIQISLLSLNEVVHSWEQNCPEHHWHPAFSISEVTCLHRAQKMLKDNNQPLRSLYTLPDVAQSCHVAKDTEEPVAKPPASLLRLRVFSLYPLHPAYEIVCFLFLCSIKWKGIPHFVIQPWCCRMTIKLTFTFTLKLFIWGELRQNSGCPQMNVVGF